MSTGTPGPSSGKQDPGPQDHAGGPGFLPPEDPVGRPDQPRPPLRPDDRLATPPAPPPPPDPGRRAFHVVLGGIGALVVAIAVVFALVLAQSPTPRQAAAPSPSPSPSPSPTPTGAPGRTVPLPDYPGRGSKVIGRIDDPNAGLSYARLGSPWRLDSDRMSDFGREQTVITERYGPDATPYWANISSDALPARLARYYGDPYRTYHASRAMLADVRSTYYPEGNRRTEVASQPIEVEGRQGWLVAARLEFDREGMRAKSELAAVAVVDTGASLPGVVYLSIPDTHKQLWPDIDTVVKSLRLLN